MGVVGIGMEMYAVGGGLDQDKINRTFRISTGRVENGPLMILLVTVNMKASKAWLYCQHAFQGAILLLSLPVVSVTSFPQPPAYERSGTWNIRGRPTGV